MIEVNEIPSLPIGESDPVQSRPIRVRIRVLGPISSRYQNREVRLYVRRRPTPSLSLFRPWF